ncbi:MAG TPA: hypothetical protein VFM98_00430 [Ramlibacter sp.]|uniref:hypothetical protein n=1 Tax=Ramlibacter sp. TaxID=1917967 RepID=UPI002D80A7F6|nr:hypothetical protein [Ramlibacter sp.]HET8744041.1 hypothetical protein [Ramlibacter sp.]
MTLARVRILEDSGATPLGARRTGSLGALRVFGIYFLAVGLLGLLSVHLTPALGWLMPPAELAAKAGYSDPSSFLQGASEIARHGWFQPENVWLIRLWPPGFMVLEAGVLRLFGETAPLLLPLLALSALACAGWMLLLREVLLPVTPDWVATAAPALPFLFPLTPFFLLSPLGLLFGETFAISFFFIGFLLALLAGRQRSWRLAVGSGIALALSAYMRSQFELIVQSLTAVALLLAVVAAAGALLRRRLRMDARTVAILLLAVIVAQGAMLPWRYHNYRDSGKGTWVHTSGLIARNSLMREQDLLAIGGAFVVQGGGHLACKLEPSYCGSPDRTLFLRAFLRHPGEWLLEKARLIPAYWLAPPAPTSMSDLRDQPSGPQALANILFFACFLAAWGCLWKVRRRPEFIVHAWMLFSLSGCLFAVYTLAHFEARYFYLPKIFSVVELVMLVALLRAGGARGVDATSAVRP